MKQKVVNVNAQQTIRRHLLILSRATECRAKISVNNDRLVILHTNSGRLHYFIVLIASELTYRFGIILTTSLIWAVYVSDCNHYQLVRHVLAFQHVLSKYFAIVRPCKLTRLITELIIAKLPKFILPILIPYRDAILDKLIRFEYIQTIIIVVIITKLAN